MVLKWRTEWKLSISELATVWDLEKNPTLAYVTKTVNCTIPVNGSAAGTASDPDEEPGT